jgi:hypothetical protein
MEIPKLNGNTIRAKQNAQQLTNTLKRQNVASSVLTANKSALFLLLKHCKWQKLPNWI